jgi:hypothetical protein
MTLRDHRQEKKKKTHPVGLGPQHGLPHNYTHWRVGLRHQLGHNCTHNDDSKTKQNRTSPLNPLIQVSRPLKRRLPPIGDGGAGTSAPPHRKGYRRAGPNAQCCCTRTGHRAACKHRVRSKLSRARGPPTRHSTHLSLSRARGPPNLPHGSTLQTRLKDSRHRSTKRCPALGNRNKLQATTEV